MKKLCSFLLIFSLICVMTACSSASDTTVADTSAEEMNISEFVALTDIVEGQPNIYLIVKIVEDSYWQGVVKGAMDKGKDLGCNVYYGGTDNDTYWEGQQELINEAVAAGADAIVLAPDDSVELVPDIEKLYDEGVSIVLIDTILNTEKFDVCYMTDNLLAGQHAAAEMISQLQKNGHSEDEELQVGVAVGAVSSQTVNERLAGFFRYWSVNAPKDWDVVTGLMNCYGTVSYGKQLVEDFLEQYPDVAGIYATNGTPTQAVAGVVAMSQRTDIAVVGFDYSDEIKLLIENSEYAASTVLQRQYDMGAYSIEAVCDLIDGDIMDVKFVDTGVYIVNNSNLDDEAVAEAISRY